MRVAYADPPYVGQARRHYQSDEVDHVQLIKLLDNNFDAWALSASSSSLQYILSLCPHDVRVGAWVKPWCSFKKNVNPAYAWEPVIFRGSRARDFDNTVRDWVSVSATKQKGLVGAKPEVFCYWLFDLLGMSPIDDFTDLYPGTGIVTKCWEKWKNSPQLYSINNPPNPE